VGKIIKKEKQQDKEDDEEEREEEDEREDNRDIEKEDDDNDNNEKDNNEKEDNNNDRQAASKKQNRIYKKDRHQTRQESLQKLMNQLKTIKSNGGKQLINAMDKHLCKMIQEYKLQLAQQGYKCNASAPFSDQDVVNVVDSDEDKDYVDLEMVGI